MNSPRPIADDIPEIALGWHRAGKGAALATVVQTWGSAPRPVGSQLAISGDGEIAGSVSGGCVEGAVVAEAIDLIASGRPKLLEFGVADEDAFAVGLACGGTIRVLVDPLGPVLPEALVAQLVKARAARDPIGMRADLEGATREVIGPAAAPDRFRTGRSGVEADGRTFIGLHLPPLRLVIVGAVHIAQALAPMARATGFDVTLVDPRGAFATPERFPGERLLEDWPDEALAAIGLDAHTAVVTLTHDPKLDDPAIEAALAAPVFYLGCLGSTRTHAKRLARLEAVGHGHGAIARIHAPVGLDIGAQSPAEIAVSILAEIVATLRAR